jgi:hypothetical protein
VPNVGPGGVFPGRRFHDPLAEWLELNRPLLNWSQALAFCLSMIFSDLPTPAEALVQRLGLCQGFAQAGNRFPRRISRAGFRDLL